MSGEFIPYAVIPFSNKAAREELEQLLSDNHIPFRVFENVSDGLPYFGNNEFQKDYDFRLYAEDFKRVDELREQQTLLLVNELPDDYYLFSFSEEELIDILRKPDEWNVVDVMLSKKLLHSKGYDVSPEMLLKMKSERLTELSKQEHLGITTLVIAYFAMLISVPLSFFFEYAASVLLGIIMLGLLAGYSRKSLPDGTRVYRYDDASRKRAKLLAIVSVVYGLLCLTAPYFILYNA